jgi:hypothetical protein
MLSGTFLVENEESQPCYIASQNYSTLMLRGNNDGDFKLKPMLIYHSIDMKALRGRNKASLYVLQVNKQSWLVPKLFLFSSKKLLKTK